MATPPDEIRARLANLFPQLVNRRFAIRAPADGRYNCIAWVANDSENWWWPDATSYWPIRARNNSVSAFAAVLATLGFVPSQTASHDPSLERVALYSRNGLITHAARIESDTRWSSKLGRLELIEHEPPALNGSDYGHPTHFFQRPRPEAP